MCAFPLRVVCVIVYDADATSPASRHAGYNEREAPASYFAQRKDT